MREGDSARKGLKRNERNNSFLRDRACVTGLDSATAFTTLDMYSASVCYQGGTAGLTNGRRLTHRNLLGYPETYTACAPPGYISAGKQEFFSPSAAAPNAPPVQDSLIIIPNGDFAWGPTTFAPRGHLLQGKVTLSGRVSLK
jgi:hypothetical protein